MLVVVPFEHSEVMYSKQHYGWPFVCNNSFQHYDRVYVDFSAVSTCLHKLCMDFKPVYTAI